MQVIGDYHSDGYAHLKGLMPPEVPASFLAMFKNDIGPGRIALQKEHVNLLNRPALDIYGFHYPPMLMFLWGLTPIVSQLVGKELLPTYDYMRLYRRGDVCKVHFDRYSCEHSLSLTLAYSDGQPWALDLGKTRQEPNGGVNEDFGGEPYSAIPMAVGDAVLYQGVHHRHGRIAPNPNGWSAHLFLHWVDRDGPHRDQAFDGNGAPPLVDFEFA